MFTGIIDAIGKVVKFERNRAWIRLPYRGVRKGESICVDGVCLTVAARSGRVMAFDIGPETRRITTLGKLRPDSRVNLERALRVGDRLGGHWVSGHVENMGRIVKWEPDGRDRWVTIDVPRVLHRFLLPKGSLSVDGISLTIAFLRQGRVRIMLIPHTLRATTLGAKKVGDPVNLEADLLAKYALQRNWNRTARGMANGRG